MHRDVAFRHRAAEDDVPVHHVDRTNGPDATRFAPWARQVLLEGDIGHLAAKQRRWSLHSRPIVTVLIHDVDVSRSINSRKTKMACDCEEQSFRSISAVHDRA